MMHMNVSNDRVVDHTCTVDSNRGRPAVLIHCSYSVDGYDMMEFALVSFLCDDVPTLTPANNDSRTTHKQHTSLVHRNASVLYKVQQLSVATPVNVISLRTESNVPAGLIAFDHMTGVFFINDTTLWMKCDFDHLIYHVTIQLPSSVSMEITLNVTIEGEAAQCKRMYRCAQFYTREECEKACGYGAPTSRCQWRQQSNPMAITDNFSTCSPNLETCPDHICDDWERKHGLCWQDCTTNVLFGWQNIDTTFGIGNAVGPCVCNDEGDCHCRNLQKTIDNNEVILTDGLSTESDESNFLIKGPVTSHRIARTDKRQPPNPDMASKRAAYKTLCGFHCIIAILVTIPIIICVTITIIAVYVRRCRTSRLQSLRLGVKLENVMELERRIDSNSSYYLSEDFLTKKKAARVAHESRWEFSRNKLIFDKLLGEGEYGRVLLAQALNIRGHTGYTPVAVKMMKDSASPVEVRDFVRELELLKQVNHPNVIRLLGAVTLKGPFLVIVEYCEHGALRSFLRANRKRETIVNEIQETNHSITPVDIGSHELMSYAWQICRGMEYLTYLKFVHRDLAARNILVTSDYVMKISDFGLSRDVYEGDTYVKQGKGRIPVKWMAVEVLYDNIYTSKSDVWSFGVLLWEMITMGASPYPGVTSERLYQILKDGYRMSRPEECSEEIYDVMLKCWQDNPTDRPTFVELSEIFENLLEEHVDYLAFSAGVNEDISDEEQ
ncbi:proto-oncogene tyrosine-protein kinase receptor Ret-like [Apostichopus japonicus]|uniref:proto-oncogene tyrosine-protein kinase receptor Ret-like n=1 Tax=Stichopus japonicus TaxID=307972 RepID=UPI003AB379EF